MSPPMQVKVEVINKDDNDCYKNYKKIGATIEGWKDDFPANTASTPGSGNLVVLIVCAILAKFQF